MSEQKVVGISGPLILAFSPKGAKELATGIVYHNESFELATLLCACGCGRRVTLLVPDSHQVSEKNGLATVTPSIAVCDAPCKSHYFISVGRVEWRSALDWCDQGHCR